MGEPKPEDPVTAAVVSTLSPYGFGESFTDAERARAARAIAWQKLGAHWDWAEVRGVVEGLPPGYFADLLGRAAAAGEQLGLAFAALRDAEVWRDTVTAATTATTTRRDMAGRALAETSGLWTVSAGHAATNVVTRVVRIHDAAAGLDAKFRWNGLPKPFDSDRRANLSLNPRTVEHTLAAARQTGEPALVELVEPLEDLTKSAAWGAVVARRDAGYHRLRPQSVAGGVPTANPWEQDPVTGALTLSIATTSDFLPPVLEDVVAEAHAGYEALAAAMNDIHDRLPAALRAVDIPIWRTD